MLEVLNHLYIMVWQSEKGTPTIAGKSRSESKDKEKKHKKHKDKDREKDKEHKKHKHRHKDRSKDKDKEKKKDKSSHHHEKVIIYFLLQLFWLIKLRVKFFMMHLACNYMFVCDKIINDLLLKWT